MLGLGACFGDPTASDGSAPIVVITSPTADVVSGTVTFSANVVDDFGVASVQFLAGSALLLDDRAPPYETPWGTVNFADGPILLRVIARDIAGNESQVTKNVTVDNTPN